MKDWIRLVSAVSILLLAVLGLSGCAILQAVTSAGASAHEAAATCSKAHAGTIGVRVSAGYAADQLRAAHVEPDLWNAMAPSEAIFLCIGDPPPDTPVFLDSSGQRTVAPLHPNSGKCRRIKDSVTCTEPISSVGG